MGITGLAVAMTSMRFSLRKVHPFLRSGYESRMFDTATHCDTISAVVSWPIEVTQNLVESWR